MIRNIIKIDEEKCNGCGLCVDACHEGALQLIDGKAKLVSESYCDGLGDCLPECPTGAISIEKREANAFDKEAVENNIKKMKENKEDTLPCGCPSTNSQFLDRGCPSQKTRLVNEQDTNEEIRNPKSNLMQWPIQIKLIPANAPYLNNTNLLIAADCAAFAYPNIQGLMKNKITLIGCPKLDSVDYSEKLTEILENNNIKSITILRMEVPCCGGLTNAVKNALIKSGKMIPWSIKTISIDGKILEE